MDDRRRTRLERVLRDRGHSVAWFARQIGYEYAHTWQTMRGMRTATPRFRARASEVLGLPESDLFEPAEEPEPMRSAI